MSSPTSTSSVQDQTSDLTSTPACLGPIATIPRPRGIEKVYAQADTQSCSPLRDRTPTFFTPHIQHALVFRQHKVKYPVTEPFKVFPPLSLAEIQGVWEKTSIILDVAELGIMQPTLDPVFDSVPFCIALSASQTVDLLKMNPTISAIQRRMSIVFQGEDMTRRRYIVERCQWVEGHRAYFKFIGTTSTGKYI